MGDPRKQRRKFSKPFRPYDKSRIEEEKELMKEFGLRRKKEIWRMEETIREFRRRARDLLAESNEKQKKELLAKLEKLGLLDKGAELEDVLSLEIKDLLTRRLQTLVKENGLSNTIRQARQMIVHGHVRVDERKVKWPSYLVPLDEERKISSDLKVKKPEEQKEGKKKSKKKTGKEKEDKKKVKKDGKKE